MSAGRGAGCRGGQQRPAAQVSDRDRGDGLLCPCGVGGAAICRGCLGRLPVGLVRLLACSVEVPGVYETAVRCSGMWLALHPVSGTAASGSPAGQGVRSRPLARAREAVAQFHQRGAEHAARDRAQQPARWHAEDTADRDGCERAVGGAA